MRLGSLLEEIAQVIIGVAALLSLVITVIEIIRNKLKNLFP